MVRSLQLTGLVAMLTHIQPCWAAPPSHHIDNKVSTSAHISVEQALQGEQGTGGLKPVTWTGQVIPGGPILSASAPSLWDIEQEIQSRYPHANFTWETAPEAPPELFRIHGIRYPFDSEGNTTKADEEIICRPINIPPYEYRASARATRWNIKYLKNLKGLCHLARATCDQIACCWNSAIGWCNNDAEKEQARPCSQFGEWAQRIHDKCQGRHGFKHWVSGDYFNYPDKIYVVVGESKC